MKPAQLKGLLEPALDRGRISARRLRLLSSLTVVYEDEGVLRNGTAGPLWRDCRCARPCWSAFPKGWRPGLSATDTSEGMIVLPWVGRTYEPGGVAVLGINLRDASSLESEYEIAWCQLKTLEEGGKKPHGSWWAYRSSRSAAAVMRSMAGDPDLDVDDPVRLAPVLDATARLQAIKCSSKDGARSARTVEMNRNCPPRYLKRELATLRPSVLIAFGYESWEAINLIGTIDESVWGDHFSRSRVFVDDLAMKMFWLHHPSAISSLWRTSHRLLVANLRERPLKHDG